MSRRRGRNSSREDYGDDFEERWKPQTYDEREIPTRMKRDGSFKSAGYICNTCGWRTTKISTGRQAMRGHLKIHARERRARRKAFFRQALFLAVVVGITILILSGQAEVSS